MVNVAGLEGPGRPRPALPARHQRPRERPEDREITARLYGGDQEHAHPPGNRPRHRRRARARRRSASRPTVCHMNEGHSAFLALERIRQLHGRARTLDLRRGPRGGRAEQRLHHPHARPGRHRRLRARARSSATSARYYAAARPRPRTSSSPSAASTPSDANEPFCMAVLALRLAGHCQRRQPAARRGLAARCGSDVWPERPRATKCRSAHITNGVHTRTWLSAEIAALLRPLPRPRLGRPTRPITASGSASTTIPDAELWRTARAPPRAPRRLRPRAARRTSSAAAARRPPRSAAPTRSSTPKPSPSASPAASPPTSAATLLFRDLERLAALLDDRDRPVQFIFAGKAHPRDDGGKELIQRDRRTSPRSREFRRRIVFLEDYDINVARYLVQGVDVWLNTPRRPLRSQRHQRHEGRRQRRPQPAPSSTAGGPRPTTATTAGPSAAAKIYDDLDYQDHVESRGPLRPARKGDRPALLRPHGATACRAAGSPA